MWLFGAIERTKKTDDGVKQGNARVIVVHNRSAAVLIPLIKRMIAPGSIIYSDEWKAY